MNQVTTFSTGKQVIDNFDSVQASDYLPLYQAAFLELSSKIQRFGKLDDGNYVMFDKDVFEDDITYIFNPTNDTITIECIGLTTVYKYTPDFSDSNSEADESGEADFGV